MTVKDKKVLQSVALLSRPDIRGTGSRRRLAVGTCNSELNRRCGCI